MKYFSLILFAVVLAMPFVLRKVLMPGAPQAGTMDRAAERLVIITPHNQDIRNEYAAAFNAWHQIHYHSEVELDFRVPGGTSDVKRQLDATYRAYRNAEGKLPADVPADISLVWGGGDSFFDRELKPLNILLPLHLSASLSRNFQQSFPRPTLVDVRLYDATVDTHGASTPRWIGVCLSSFGICYNPDVYRTLGIPEPSPELGWESLTDPRLAGLVALADPAHSGSSAVAYQMVIQHKMAESEKLLFARRPGLAEVKRSELAKNAEYRDAIASGWKEGMKELVKIAANARYFTDSSTLVPTDVSRGEAAAGMAIDFYARVAEESVGPQRMGYIAPLRATAVTPDPVAVLYGTNGRKLELSEHFIEFLLSAEGQRLWILKPHAPGGPRNRALRRMPIRADVYADRTNWADNIDPFTVADGFNQRAEWMALLGDSRPIWVAAWIDSRDALQNAYGKILALPDPILREKLINHLAQIPIEMTDVENVRTERLRREQAHEPLDEWRANQQIDWALKFRQHYRTVAADAR